MLDEIAPEELDTPAEDEPARRRLDWVWHNQTVRDYLPIVVVLVVVAWLCKVLYQPGHDWGDDFSLYIHQAQGIANGNIGEVIATNRYAIDNSGWNSFSPLVYPWGFPLLLAPVIAIWGVSYAKLKLVVIASFLGFLFFLYRLFLRRTGPIPAALIVALLGSSVSYVGWTASVLSDYPYLFFAMLTLVWIDRCRDRDVWEKDGVRDLIILGILIGYSFSTRREGLALLASLFAVQLVALWPRLVRIGRREARLLVGSRHIDAPAEADDAVGEPTIKDIEPADAAELATLVDTASDTNIRWSRIAVPWVSFVTFVVGLQLMLPSVIFPHFAGTGTKQIKPNIIWFRDILAEDIGLKDIGVNKLSLLGSTRLAALALGLFVGLAVVGLLLRTLIAFKQDASIIAYSVGLFYIVGTQPFHEGRYLFGFVPLMAYFGYQASPTLFRWARMSVVPVAVIGALALAGLVVANSTDMKHAVDYHRVYRSTINGPTTPAAVEMESKVIQCTRGDDVVAFFRARAMSMLTNRKSIQTGDITQIMQRADWYVMNVGSTYSQPLVTDAQAQELGLRKVWANSEWVLWLIPGGRAADRHLSC